MRSTCWRSAPRTRSTGWHGRPRDFDPGEFGDSAWGMAERARGHAAHLAGDLYSRSPRSARVVRGRVEEQPWIALAVVGAVAVVLGYALRTGRLAEPVDDARQMLARDARHLREAHRIEQADEAQRSISERGALSGSPSSGGSGPRRRASGRDRARATPPEGRSVL